MSILWVLANTVLWSLPLCGAAILKAIFRTSRFRSRIDRAIEGVALRWIRINDLGLTLLTPVAWEVSGDDQLRPDDWYLVIANHQSWLDILVLERVFCRHIPLLKFFLKRELIWVPVLGLAWWALDFPFMQRYPREFLESNPHMRGKDLEATRRACRRFRTWPTSITNFVEGTRFTRAKHRRQGSPYRHLLRPRAGGVAFVLGAMGDQIHQLLDVSIAYPAGNCGLWEFLCGHVPRIVVRVESLPVTAELLGDYSADAAYRERFQEWLNQRWAIKDRWLWERMGSPP